MQDISQSQPDVFKNHFYACISFLVLRSVFLTFVFYLNININLNLNLNLNLSLFSLTPHTSCLTPHTSCLTPHTSRLTPHASSLTPSYSYLSASTGFFLAARQLCQLTVSNAIPMAIIPAKAKIHQLNSVL